MQNFLPFFLIKSRFLLKIIFNLHSVCRIRIRYEKGGSPPKIWRKMNCNLTWMSMRRRLGSYVGDGRIKKNFFLPDELWRICPVNCGNRRFLVRWDLIGTTEV